MIHYFIKAIKSYATFAGRSRRKEYWYFSLASVCGAILLMLFTILVPQLIILYVAWWLALLIPAISVGVRRMHDTGRSGWYLLIPFYSLYLVCVAGDAGENAYGPDPKADKEEWDFDKKTLS